MNLMEAVHYAEYLQHFPPYSFHTGKSFSEVLILASTNPQYDKIVHWIPKVQYMNIASSEHIVYIKLFWMSKQKKTNVVFIKWTGKSMDNL